MLEVSRKSWHFRFYNWFNEGKLPRIINLCSYVRTAIFWTPLKAVFYTPGERLYRKSKSLFYSVYLALIVAIAGILTWRWGWEAGYYFVWATVIAIVTTKLSDKVIARDWEENKDTKFVQYTERTGQTIKTGFKYSVGLLFKTIFWTMWTKMYNFHQALFWSVLAIVVAAIWYGLVLVGVWWKVLAGIGALLIAIAIIVGIVVLIDWLRKDRKVDLNNNIAWQFLKAKKRKICPFIELRD